MRVLLNAQREIADKMLDAQWEAKWRQEQVSIFRWFYWLYKRGTLVIVSDNSEEPYDLPKVTIRGSLQHRRDVFRAPIFIHTRVTEAFFYDF